MDAPILRDIPLGLPAPELLLEILAVVSFLAHIFFVALMVGGSILTLILELRGRKDPDFDRLAHLVGRTITVNKSMAVVLGVAPLLILNTLYTVFFYSANALTGTAWIMIVPLVIAAFLLSYAHEYSWDYLEDHRGLHLGLAFGSASLFAFLPLIFLANVNLMLYPEWWSRVKGFLTALILPNVLPRYLHFLTASIALTGLFLVWYTGRKAFPMEEFEDLSRDRIRRIFYSVAFGATALQLFFGPLLFFTLPAHTVTWSMAGVIFVGACLALAVLWLLWLEVRSEEAASGKRFLPIVALLTFVVIFMATGRHMVRETAVEPHRQAMAAHTAEYMAAVRAHQDYVLIPGGLGGEALSPGAAVFRKVCASCHDRDSRLVGPPIVEIAEIYQGNPQGIIAWTKEPGKKRPDYPVMPPQNLSEEDLKAVAEYLLAM